MGAIYVRRVLKIKLMDYFESGIVSGIVQLAESPLYEIADSYVVAIRR